VSVDNLREEEETMTQLHKSLDIFYYFPRHKAQREHATKIN